jgi:hypothetical protein
LGSMAEHCIHCSAFPSQQRMQGWPQNISKFEGVRYLIVDEKSMVGLQQLSSLD